MTAFAIPSVPGFWPDQYICSNDQKSIIETITRMIKHSASDFPSTTLCDIKIVPLQWLVSIHPVVLDRNGNIHDFSPKEGELVKEND